MMKRTILVIEDNALNMELVTDLLETAGYRVLQASDAEQGIALARRTPPLLILMDIALPGMDGLKATATLSQDLLTRGVPVVALTAHAMAGDADRAIAAGCVGYIAKPIDTRTFAEKVANYAGVARPIVRAA